VELSTTSISGRLQTDATTEGSNSYTATGPSSTANGLSLSLRETPQSVTVVTRKKMDDFNEQTLKDVLSSTPGITVITPYGDIVRIYSRGAEIQNFQTDGNRHGQSGTQSAGAPGSNNFVDDDMAAIDHIEILKGSAGLLQGDGYPTATINMIRKKPTPNFQAAIGTSAGSWDTYRSDIDVGGPLTENGNVRGRVVASYKDANSYKDSVQKRNSLFYGTLDFDLSKNTLINVGLDYKKRQQRGSSPVGARAYDTNGNARGLTSRSWNSGAPWAGYEQNILSAFFTLEHNFSDDWQSKINLSSEKSEIPEWSAGHVQYEHKGYAWIVDSIESTTKNASLDLNGKFNLISRQHEILFGLDFMKSESSANDNDAATEWYSSVQSPYLQNTVDLDNYLIYGGRYYPDPGSEKVYYMSYGNETIRRGVFLATRLNLTDNLKFLVGARGSDYIYRGKYDDSHVTETGVITPYSGLVYDIDENFSLYASYASIFQPVSVQDEEGNVLKPQDGVTYEVGSKAELYNGRLNASLAFFWKRWENTYELSGGFTPTGDSAYRNIDGIMEHGYELEISGELLPGLQAQGGYVVNSSELEGSSGIPKHQFKLNASYRLPENLNKLTMGAGLRWQSEIYTDTYSNGVKLKQESYWLADLMMRYDLNKKTTVGLNINNIFDKKYFSGVGGVPGWGSYYTWGEPRNITIRTRYSF
jgi:outer membrane receptor for ferric coprogen and ferric-rhodotorulic acid